MEMNIYAMEGYKVKVSEHVFSNHYTDVHDLVATWVLERDKEYEVEYTVVTMSHSWVKLKGIETKYNTIHFTEVEPQADEITYTHPDWIRYMLDSE